MQVKKSKNLGAKALLNQIDLFKGLTPANLEALAAVCRLKTVSKQDILFLEGTQGKHIYLLAQGAVQLNKTSPDGKRIIIKTVRPGDMFAEVILFEKETYPVTAIAIQASRLYLIPKAKILSLLEDKKFWHNFMRGLLEKHRYLVNRILYLSAHDVEERFALYLKEHYGNRPGRYPALSKKDVAAAIGTSPETLSRLLLKLKKAGTVLWEKREIQINR